MQFASLGSGSKGNATIVRAGETTLMIDCGFGWRDLLSRLDRLGVQPEDLDAVLVTHEHGDHIRGVPALAKRLQIPVYMTNGTRLSAERKGGFLGDIRSIQAGSDFRVNDIVIRAVPVPHDAREPVQFVMEYRKSTLGVLTDLGYITSQVAHEFGHCRALMLESNHCRQMLATGPYPATLKQRVGGNYGHLSNHQAAGLLSQLDVGELQHLVIAHISETNNTLERVREQIEPRAGTVANVTYATQDRGLEWLTIQ